MSYTPSELRPPGWLIMALAACLATALLALVSASESPAAAPAEAADPLPAVSSAVTAAPSPTPPPTPEPDWSAPVPRGEAADQEEWFADAVFIGDSRVDGFRLFSGVTPDAAFLVHTGITVFEVLDGKEVIREGGRKVSILDALGEKSYGKVYISLGINELGYRSPEKFADAYGELIDAVRAVQPDALLYVQSILPVNTAKCAANDQFSYVTNENIAAYNEALAALCEEKKVRRLDAAEVLADETGEVLQELSADGVHFKKEGYVKWLDYLTTHTGV